MELDPLEDTINQLSDRDSNWWPFLWLRPEKHADLGILRVTSLSVLYGLPFGALLAIVICVLGHEPASSGVVTALGFPLFCLFVGTVIIAPMWNRRAGRLRIRAGSTGRT